MRRSSLRRGITNVQWVFIAGAIVLVLFATVQIVGTKTKSKLDETVTDVGDPTHLTTRWGKSK
jgi:hypothetical protein